MNAIKGILLGLAASMSFGPAEVRAQGTIQSAIDRQCSAGVITDKRQAIYAAGLGAITAQPGTRQPLLAALSERGGAETCAAAISGSMCNRTYLQFAVANAQNLAVNPAGRAFYSTLGIMDAAGDPAGNVGTIAGATAGGLTGLLLGGDNRLKGGLIGAGIGAGVGGLLGAGYDHQRCLGTQADFDAVTAKLAREGMRPVRDVAALQSEINRLFNRLTGSEQQTARAMLGAIDVAAARIDAMR